MLVSPRPLLLSASRWYLNVCTRPLCLPLALLLLHFLPLFASCSFHPFLFFSVPPPSTPPSFRLSLLVDAINYATATWAQLRRCLERSFRFSRYRTGGPASPWPRENRRRTGLEEEIKAGLEANELRIWIWDISDPRNLMLRTPDCYNLKRFVLYMKRRMYIQGRPF